RYVSSYRPALAPISDVSVANEVMFSALFIPALSERALPGSDEDLVVTFSRRADLLPHARYDCPIQPFMATECEISAPVHNNKLICEQCFCYICDKLASQCESWSSSGVCHCNSHKRSTFWNNLRNNTLLGGLQSFNLTLCEIDSHLRHAGNTRALQTVNTIKLAKPNVRMAPKFALTHASNCVE
uniref:Uncharacterized protein n=1 Tax=Neogobius melanostomus TaxID=47308 RepID=A0A8C6TEN7_9GOBI